MAYRNGRTKLLTSGLVLSRHIQNTIGINVEGDSDLGHPPGCRGDARQLKFAQQVVIPGHGPLPLKDLDQHSRLVVSVGGEDLLLLGGDGGVSGDEGGHDTTCSLNAHGQRGNVQQQKVLDLGVALASQNGSLQCEAEMGIAAKRK